MQATGGSFLSIAGAIDCAAAREAAMVGRVQRLGVRIGLSRPALLIAMDEARERYDLLVEGHQLMVRLVPIEAEIVRRLRQ